MILEKSLDERPAIDPKPGIRWEWSSEEEIYASIPELVKWLIEALESFGYEFTDPLSLQRSATELLRKTGELEPGGDKRAAGSGRKYFAPG